MSSGHPIASFEASRILREGGNAIDAAIVAALVLSVVSPHACSLGGDAFILVFHARSNGLFLLNGSGAAPANAEPRFFQNGIPPTGPLSVTVPGAPAAWEEALGRFGSIAWKDAVTRAVRYAEEGFVANEYLVENIRTRRELVSRNSGLAKLFLDGNEPILPGSLIRQSALARSLDSLARFGASSLYEGDIGVQLARAIAAQGAC